MRGIFGLLCVCGALVAQAQPGPPKATPMAGWIGVFPAMLGYQHSYQQPVVSADKTSYQQSVKYVWTGNDFREATATLARDPKFKMTHQAAALTKAGAKETKIGTKDAWIMPAQGKEGAVKIIVPLGEDTALIVEGVGVAHKNFPNELAGKFDPAKAAAALQQPPRTDFSRTVEAFKALKKGMSLAEVREWVGEAEKDIGSGIHILQYTLDDKSQVLIGFPSFDKLVYVNHLKDGKSTSLAN